MPCFCHMWWKQNNVLKHSISDWTILLGYIASWKNVFLVTQLLLYESLCLTFAKEFELKSWLRKVVWNNGASDPYRFTNLKCWWMAGGRGVFRYPYHPTSRVLNQRTSLVKFLAPYSRVLKNLRICMFYPNICMFFIKTDRSCLQFKVICREIPSFWQTINMVRAR